MLNQDVETVRKCSVRRSAFGPVSVLLVLVEAADGRLSHECRVESVHGPVCRIPCIFGEDIADRVFNRVVRGLRAGVSNWRLLR